MEHSVAVNDVLRDSAVQDVLKEQSIRRRKLGPMQFINEVSKKFIEKQLDFFPQLCQITRVQNKIKLDELMKSDTKGKYTDSYGWSDSKNFKFEYEIPSELHLFMINLVYRDFWSNENRAIWRTFMKKILRGDDAMETLMWAKSIYGSNTQKLNVVN